jgi:hypothetical protein
MLRHAQSRACQGGRSTCAGIDGYMNEAVKPGSLATGDFALERNSLDTSGDRAPFHACHTDLRETR